MEVSLIYFRFIIVSSKIGKILKYKSQLFSWVNGGQRGRGGWVGVDYAVLIAKLLLGTNQVGSFATDEFLLFVFPVRD